MFEPNNRIIIVDDLEAHLITLAKCFLENGIGCRTILYSALHNQPLKGIRIAFFDINITNKFIDLDASSYNYKVDRDLSAVFNDLATAISSCIHIDNGPYALVFWSSNTKLIENFVEYIRDEAKGFSNLPSPILIDSIDKDKFLSGSVEELTERINDIFKNKSLKLLLNFQELCNNGVSELIDTFYKIIPKNTKVSDQVWGNSIDFDTNFDKIFSKIAHSTLGFEYSKSNPDKAITEALLPIHNQIVLNKATESNSWKTGLNNINARNVSYPKNFNFGKLNSIFHIEMPLIDEKDIRGGVFDINLSQRGILGNLNIDNLQQWIAKIIPFKKEFKIEEVDFISGCKLIALEISAACDSSNKKKRINKYMLGLLTPHIDVKKYIQLEQRPENSYHLGGTYFNFQNNDFQIWLNLNYVFGANPNDKRLGNIKFVLKKEIMDMVGNKYASHVSRIGITTF